MGQFTFLDYDYSDVSLNEGYAMWRKNEGRWASIGYGFTCRGRVVPGPHWSGKWIATGGMGNRGIHIITPVSPEARKLVRMHMTNVWAHRYGISYRDADALYHYRGPYKYELIAVICNAIKDECCHAAFLAFPGVGPGRHLDWMRRWWDVVSGYCCRSWSRNESLINAVNYVIKSRGHS